jgi:rfaE bifunctional protein kinase chain/domain
MTHLVSIARAAELLQAARGKRITVVGDAMLDVYLTGDVERISPEAPVPVVHVRDRKYALGGAANVAQNVAAIGASCQLVATVGNDGAGATFRSLLRPMGVDDEHLLTIARCTTQKTRVVARAQQLLRVDEEEGADLDPADADRLIAIVEAGIRGADALILEDYNKGVLGAPTIRRSIAAAKRRGIPVIVDPKFKNFFAYSGATVFKPNKKELEAAIGSEIDVEVSDALPNIARKLAVDHLLLTRGELGMVLYSADGELTRIPAAAREVYDVVGAGDTVTAYLASIMSAGGTAREAAAIANLAAGIEVGKLGAATVSPQEILEYLSSPPAA